jgi:predicted nucleic acid-binding Zn ribbon protein
MRYDYYCPNPECKIVVRDIDKSLEDPAPCCPRCGIMLERLFDRQVVYFRGFTTPGGNGTPKEIINEIKQ